ncbi:MAG: immune inhibitor A domain-containing protein [Symbiobacteriia bacterium]
MSSPKRSWLKSLAVGISGTLLAAAVLTPSFALAKPVAHDAPPFDAAVAQIDRLADALQKQGVIPAGADQATREQLVAQYLNKRALAGGALADKSNGRNSKAQALRNQAGIHVQTPVSPAAAQPWDGGLRTDKILVLLVEYSDFTHNNITSDETDMFYSDYTRDHFQQMIFGEGGYTGPNGENLISMKQYYLQQSGGSYTVEGGVFGWYKAPQPAAYYGGNVPDPDGSDARPRSVVYQALKAAVANGVDLSQYDQEDQYDIDGDGNLREPDGLVDHLMVLHAGVGEEAGGGSLGGDAIWSHSWDLGGVYTFDSPTSVPYWGGRMGAYGYTIEPEDGATGVFAHEFGHDLGLPDEYDTIYSGGGEPVEYYSIMSSGSWAGLIPGTEPSGFSPYAKEFYQGSMGGNWQLGPTVNLADIPAGGLTFTLDQASTHGTNNDVVRINLPDQANFINQPTEGTHEYFGGKGDEIDHTMVANVDLTGAISATLNYDIWYDIEPNWDFAFVQVSTDGGANWQSLSTPNTTSDLVADGYPAIRANLPGYTGNSGGWLHETADLTAYAGQAIKLQYRYMTDWGANLTGVFVDNVQVTANTGSAFSDGAEGPSAFALDGFSVSDGTFTAPHYYLVEWRNHAGVDMGLAHIKRGFSVMANDPGMLIWYVNGSYGDNWVGYHPGRGFLGVVDSHQNVHHWGGNAARGVLAGTRYQIYDAAFSLTKGSNLDLTYGQGQHIFGAAKNPIPTFDDRSNYWSPSSVYSGLKIPTYGLKISVVGEAADRSAATIKITK